ncbi:hypothetical protein D9M73_94110 [compost metagenome]
MRHRIVKRPAIKPKIARLGPPHRRQQRKARHIGIAPRRHQGHLRVQQFLFGIQNIENGTVTDAVFGAHAFQRQFVGVDRHFARRDHLERGLPDGISRPRLRDDATLGLGNALDRLQARILSLPDLRRWTPALIERHRQPETNRRGRARLANCDASSRTKRSEIIVIIAADVDADLGQTIRARHAYVISRRLTGLGGRQQRRIVLQRDVHRSIGIRRKIGERRWRLERVGRAADIADIAFPAGNQPSLRRFELPAGDGKARFGLGDVGTCQIPDLEPIAAGLQIDLKHLHILGIEADDRFIADHVHISPHNRGEQIGLGPAQAQLAAFDPGLRSPHAVAHRATGIKRDRQGRARRAAAVRRDETVRGFDDVFGIGALQGDGRKRLRPRDRHVFVVCAHICTLRGERRVGVIRLDQRLAQRFRRKRGCREPE